MNLALQSKDVRSIQQFKFQMFITSMTKWWEWWKRYIHRNACLTPSTCGPSVGLLKSVGLFEKRHRNNSFAFGASGLAALVVSSSMDLDIGIRTLVEGYSHFLKLLLFFSVKRPKCAKTEKCPAAKSQKKKKAKKKVVMAFNPRTWKILHITAKGIVHNGWFYNVSRGYMRNFSRTRVKP